MTAPSSTLVRFFAQDKTTRALEISLQDIAAADRGNHIYDLFPELLERVTRYGNQPAQACLRSLVDLGAYLHSVQDSWIIVPNRDCFDPARVSISVVSSRISKASPERRIWLDQMRSYVGGVDPANVRFILAEQTTADPYVAFLADYFNVVTTRLGRWKARMKLTDLSNLGGSDRNQAWVIGSPTKMPLDPIQIELAEEVRCLSVRPGGVVFQAIEQHLASPNGMRKKIFVSLNSAGTRDLDWLNRGAIGWFSYLGRNKQTPTSGQSKTTTAKLDLAKIEADQFIHHFTRPRSGAWPDQSNANYIDEEFFHRSEIPTGGLEALCRILASQRLLAGNRLSRSSQNVCCFTAVPLAEFESRRQFRSHLSRWDFLPFGISVRKSVIERMGGRPVIYCDPSSMEAIENEQTWYHHPAQTLTTQGNVIEWTQEHEWRMVGDLDLSSLRPSDCFIFVPDQAAYETIAKISRFPAVLLA